MREGFGLTRLPAIGAARGGLKLRLAATSAEVDACQALRYRVFYEELGAVADAKAASSRRDADRFDGFCDHLMVVSASPTERPNPINVPDGELVGTYRLLRQEIAERQGGFYTSSEFDIAPLVAAHPELRFLELGRSCVLAPYRTRPVVELLWQGIWNYVRAHRLDVMFGCASFEGTDPDAHALPLTFLMRNRQAPPEWRVRARPERFVAMDRVSGSIDAKAAVRAMPPLIKGYLRLGCYFGEGAVIDRQFNTVDVLILLPVSAIDTRYFAHFGQPSD